MYLLFWTLFLGLTLWGSLPFPYPVRDSASSLPFGGLCLVPYVAVGPIKKKHGNHLYVDCPGVGYVAPGLRTWSCFCPWYAYVRAAACYWSTAARVQQEYNTGTTRCLVPCTVKGKLSGTTSPYCVIWACDGQPDELQRHHC